MKWEEVLSAITFDDLGKEDYHAPIKHTRLASNGNIYTNARETNHVLMLKPNDHALSQLSSRLGIPTRYAKKCYEEDPKLLAQHVNHWLDNLSPEEQERDYYLRTKGNTLRAVLTDKYSKLDNSFVTSSLDRLMKFGGDVDIRNFDLTDKHFNLRLVFPDMTMDVGTLQNPDKIMVGVHITNSEVGSSALRVDSCLFRLVCSNGMIARVGGSSMMAQRHLHLTSNEMDSRFSRAIEDAVMNGNTAISDFAYTKDIYVPNPMNVIKKLAEDAKYTKSFTQKVEESFHIEPDETAFHVINAFTRASQVLPFEQRLEVETNAGNMMQKFIKGKESGKYQGIDPAYMQAKKLFE